MQFADSSSLVITGEPPAPPPPPPKEEPPPPPKPKRVEVAADKIVIHEKIQFDLNKATIKPDSNGLLDEIVSVINENAFIKKISIEGHTDNQGADAYNKKLSDQRAKSVLEYLTSHGVAAEKLTATGFGESKPIASNDDEEGREKNRRVEFIITEQDEVKKTYEIDPKTGEKKQVLTKEEKQALKDKAKAEKEAAKKEKAEKAAAEKEEAKKAKEEAKAAADKEKAEKKAAAEEKKKAAAEEKKKAAEEKKAEAEKKKAEAEEKKKAEAEKKEEAKEAAP